MGENSTRTSKIGQTSDSNGRVEKRWDRESENTPLYAIVSAVGEATGTDPLELPPLAEVIDPDALEAVLTSPSGTGDRRVSFEYVDHTVVVRSDGTVLAEAA